MDREEARRLVHYLDGRTKDGYTIVSWNGLGFDFDVLAEESELRETCRRLAREHVDLMFHVFCRLGHCLSLASAAEGMALPGKTDGMTSLAAPKLWAEGKRKEVLQYVVQDVRLTLALAKKGETDRQIRWVSRSGRKRRLALPNGWLPVRLAKRLPEPFTFWMTSRLPRTQFTAWLD